MFEDVIDIIEDVNESIMWNQCSDFKSCFEDGGDLHDNINRMISNINEEVCMRDVFSLLM